MGDLTKNLSRWEFECPCECGADVADYKTVTTMQDACDHFGKEYDVNMHISVNSANRCLDYNRTIEGSSDKSKHIKFKAVDFYLWYKIGGIKHLVEDDALATYIEKNNPGRGGIGRYNGRVHYDDRTAFSRWDNR